MFGVSSVIEALPKIQLRHTGEKVQYNLASLALQNIFWILSCRVLFRPYLESHNDKTNYKLNYGCLRAHFRHNKKKVYFYTNDARYESILLR